MDARKIISGLSTSNYLKAADLQGQRTKVKVSKVEVANIKGNDGKEQTKFVLSFEGKEKTLPLNVTNTEAMANAFGYESEQWAGKEITLYAVTTSMGEGIRIDTSQEVVTQAPKPDPEYAPNGYSEEVPPAEDLPL